MEDVLFRVWCHQFNFHCYFRSALDAIFPFVVGTFTAHMYLLVCFSVHKGKMNECYMGQIIKKMYAKFKTDMDIHKNLYNSNHSVQVFTRLKYRKIEPFKVQYI